MEKDAQQVHEVIPGQVGVLYGPFPLSSANAVGIEKETEALQERRSKRSPLKTVRYGPAQRHQSHNEPTLTAFEVSSGF